MFLPIVEPAKLKHPDEMQGLVHGQERTENSMFKDNTHEKIHIHETKPNDHKEESVIIIKEKKEEAEALDQDADEKDGRRWTFAGPVLVKGR